MRLWDPATGTAGRRPPHRPHRRGDGGGASRLRTGTLLATTSGDRRCGCGTPPPAPPSAHTLTGHTDAVTAVAVVALPDGRTLLATASDDGTVRLWDPATGTPVGDPSPATPTAVTAVAFRPDGHPARHHQRRRDGAVLGPRHRHPGR